MASKLTAEQLKKIEENRRKALLKREQKAALQTENSYVVSSVGPHNQSIGNTEGCQKPVGTAKGGSILQEPKNSSSQYNQQSLVTPSLNMVNTSSIRSCVNVAQHSNIKPHFTPDNFSSAHAANATSVISSKTALSGPSVSSSVSTNPTTSAIDHANIARIEQNRLKALAKRAGRLNKSPVKGVAPGPALSSLPTANSMNSSSSAAANKVSVSCTTVPSSDSHQSMNPSCPSGSIGQPSAQAMPSQWNMFGGVGKSKVKGKCVLLSRELFTVNAGYCSPLIELFKAMNTKLYDAVTKKWSLHLSEYNKFMTALQSMGPGMDIEPLPAAILKVFNPVIRGQNSERHIPIADLSRVEPSLVNSLMSFQREGVNFGVYKNGRVLIADDMGLGKTIQAICLACYYRDEWPLLIVVPSSVRFDWAQNLKRWVPSLDPQSIQVAVTGKDSCTSGLVNILSYDLMAKKADVLKNHHFRIVIMDECHLLKNFKTARCKAAVPILKNAKRVLLLSGTPALSRPLELYTQIDAVCPYLFKYHDFGVRYCDGKKTNFGWDFSGSSNMAELQIVLEEKVMIRRLKKDVLKELPDKIRQMILLDPSSIKIDKSLKNASKVLTSSSLKRTEERGALLDFFHKSGTSKLKAIKNYVEDLMEEEKKFLIFAHHGDVLDGIEEVVKNKIDNNYIRIDGRTSSEARNILCQRFQHRDSVRVAILSITACNAGLNLSSASLVIFSELFWNPGILVQAEDRVHRIGQQDMVVVQYLVAKGTSDDHIWPMIQKKLDVLGKAGLTKDNFSTAETSLQLDPRQEEITRFLEESFSDDFPDFPPSTPPRTDSQQQDNEEKEFVPTTSSPTKVAKQQSILQYTSPLKDLPHPIHSATSPLSATKPKGIHRYFSPEKVKMASEREQNNNVKKQSLFTTVDSKNRTAESSVLSHSSVGRSKRFSEHQCQSTDALEDLFNDDDDDLIAAESECERLNVKPVQHQPVKRRRIEPFQPPFRRN